MITAPSVSSLANRIGTTTGQKRMATLEIDQHSFSLLKVALSLLPRRVGFRVVRIALNAWGGYVRNQARSLAPEETGLLKKSLKVKAVIPDSSYNEKHHGKPAYVMVGPARGVKALVQDRRTVTRARLEKTGWRGNRVSVRRPSRYAHLVERGTASGVKASYFMNRAQRAGNVGGLVVLKDKLTKGIEAESAALAQRN